jgi:hypothetical protein
VSRNVGRPALTVVVASPPSRCRAWCTRRTWWLALALLVANDHYLKGANILPGWLTGKLSDFAGLIVAPVVAAAGVRARSTGQRGAVFALVALAFASVKLDAETARLVEQLLRSFGLRSRLWSDPTDLIALAVLPMAWNILATPCADLQPREESRWRAHIAIALGAAGCIATSSGPSGQASLYLLNATRRTQVVAIHRAAGDACNDVDGAPEEALPPEAFTFERCVKLSPFDLLGLDPPDTGTAVDPQRRCDAVAINGPGRRGLGLWWGDTTVRRIDTNYSDLDDRRVTMLQVGEQVFYEPSPLTLTWDIPEDAALVQCPAE